LTTSIVAILRPSRAQVGIDLCLIPTTFVSPKYASDQSIYLTYSEPCDYGGGLAVARAKLNVNGNNARLQNLEVLWRQMPKGKGGQGRRAGGFRARR
jgi:hypothetical protein